MSTYRNIELKNDMYEITVICSQTPMEKRYFKTLNECQEFSKQYFSNNYLKKASEK